LDAHIDSISSEKNQTWQVSKKRDVKLLEKFAIRTENGIQATLYYTTKQNHQSHIINLTRTDGKLILENNAE